MRNSKPLSESFLRERELVDYANSRIGDYVSKEGFILFYHVGEDIVEQRYATRGEANGRSRELMSERNGKGLITVLKEIPSKV